MGELGYSVSRYPAGTTFTAKEHVLKRPEKLLALGKFDKGAVGPEDLFLTTKTLEEERAEAAGSAHTGYVAGGLLSALGAVLPLLGWKAKEHAPVTVVVPAVVPAQKPVTETTAPHEIG